MIFMKLRYVFNYLFLKLNIEAYAIIEDVKLITGT